MDRISGDYDDLPKGNMLNSEHQRHSFQTIERQKWIGEIKWIFMSEAGVPGEANAGDDSDSRW